MTERDKIDWLGRYLDSLREQKALEMETDRLQAYADHVGPRLADGQSTERGGSDAVDRLIQAHDELRAEINRCLVVRAEVRAVIQATPNQRQREILLRRYILGQTFDAIARDMHLDLRYTYRLHRRAVLALDIPEPCSADGVHVDAGAGVVPNWDNSAARPA